MDGNELTQLMDERHETLQTLLELGRRQTDAIQTSHMNELMAVLSEKQQPLNKLGELADRIRGAANDDPAARRWTSEAARALCRQRQEECEQMHLELLAIEASCQSALSESRTTIGEQIKQLDASHRAAQHYAPEQRAAVTGSRLDLSE